MEVIKVENLSKTYDLGLVGTGTLSKDLNRAWARITGKPDPYATLAELNDRTQKSESGTVYALKDINFSVEQGEVLGIIGRNGAGKSTLLKILSQITSPTTGSIKIKGRVASLLEVGTGMHPEMTARQNIYLNGSIMGMRRHEITRKLDEIIDFAGIAKYVDTPIKRFSSGMQVRLGFAVAAFLEPEILIVDEVLAVGDAEFQKKAIGKMQDVSKGEGRTVLFVSHNMESIANLCNNALLLNSGKLSNYGDINYIINLYNNFSNFQVNTKYSSDLKKRRTEIYFEQIEICNSNNNFASDKTIVIKCIIKSSIDLSDFRIGVRIVNQLEKVVGLFFTQEILNIVSNNLLEVEIEIVNHNLAFGNYFLDFSIGKGNETTFPIDFEFIEKPVSLCVNRRNVNSTELISSWNQNNWGNINFQNNMKIITRCK